MESLRCCVEQVVYKNHDNDYCVLQVSNDMEWNTIVGTMPGVNIGMTIIANGEWTNNKKFGRQFTVSTWHEELPDNVVGIEKYLASGIILGIGPKKARLIVSVFKEKTMEVMDNDIDRLLEVPSIGKTCLERIKRSWKEQKGVRDVMVFLQSHGISATYAAKIYKEYKNESIQKVQENPYCLADDIFGIGFKMADEIARSFGYERNDIRRCRSGVIYTLNQLAKDGHCYAEWSQLITTANALLSADEDAITNALDDMIANDMLIVDDNAVFLPIYYYSEVGVANKLKSLLKNDDDDIDPDKLDMDAISDNITYDDIQKAAIYEAIRSKVMVLTGGPGCVDCNTEYFNGTEWRKISEYRNGDKVLQYNMDGTAELVKPLRYIKEPCDHMTLIKSKYGVNQCVSDDHRLVYETEKGVFRINTTEEVRAKHEASFKGFRGRFYTSFRYNGKGIDLSDAEIRLMCAVVCDGHFYSKIDYNKICCVNIKKQRKKERLEKLLNDADAIYEKKQNNPHDKEFVCYYFDAPRKEKSFGAYWYNCNQHQLEVFCDEICRWDGCCIGKRKEFCTTVKETADFVQFAFAATGRRARVFKQDRVNASYLTNGKKYFRKSLEYRITISDRTKVSIHNVKNKDNMKDAIPEDGYKYCFTVPSSMLVLRREGCINITGNCGKTVTTNGIIKAMELYDLEVLCAAPTGRAAKRMTEVTGKEAKTIHRLLEYKPDEGFTRNEKAPLSGDVLIVDEASMIDIMLMNSLLKAVPDGMRLILVGDIDQLPSVGAGNVLRDIIDSESVPVVRLTRIFRQAQTSRIVMNAHRVNHGEYPDVSNGRDSDFFFMSQDDPERCASEVVNLVCNRLPKAYGYNPSDIQVLVPMIKSVVGTVNLNILLQDAINPVGEFIQCGQYKYRVGDKVMQIRNDYDKNVFNGDIGVVEELNSEDRTMTVAFDKNIVEYESSELTELTLAYACTIHKSQGSEYPVVVMPLMMSHYIMLQRNLVYTGITRAKKLCVVIGDTKALGHAIRNFCVLKRNTRLKERLRAKS